jgi:hypothetical protein
MNVLKKTESRIDMGYNITHGFRWALYGRRRLFCLFPSLLIVLLSQNAFSQIAETEPNDNWGDPGIITIINDTAVGNFGVERDTDLWYIPAASKGLLEVHYDSAPLAHSIYLYSGTGDYGTSVAWVATGVHGGADISEMLSSSLYYSLSVGTGTALGAYSFTVTFTELPVELVSFDALVDGNDVMLFWETASEKSNIGFEVQSRGPTLNAFLPVTFIEGQGDSRQSAHYSCRIKALDSGSHQFRLKQIDADGTFTYSPTLDVEINLPGTHRLTNAYPNPFNSQATFSLTVAQEQQVHVELFDALGRKVRTLYNGTLTPNISKPIRIDAAHLPTGLYSYLVTGEYFRESKRLVLSK